MNSNDLNDGVDAVSDETDRSDETIRSGLEGDLSRASSLSDRLRSDASRSTRDRRLAGGFLAVGVLCFAGALVVPALQQLLASFAGIGLFAGVLAYGLSGGRTIDARDGRRVYGACADNLAALVRALPLSDERIYVARSSDADDVRLFVPRDQGGRLPEAEIVSVVDPYGRGLVLVPTGAELYDEFRGALTEAVARSPEPLAEQLTDALSHRFELVDDVDPVIDADAGRATIAVSGSAFGSIDRFDHPVASFLAVGFAAGLNRDVSLQVSATTDRGVQLVTCHWGGEGADG